MPIGVNSNAPEWSALVYTNEFTKDSMHEYGEAYLPGSNPLAWSALIYTYEFTRDSIYEHGEASLGFPREVFLEKNTMTNNTIQTRKLYYDLILTLLHKHRCILTLNFLNIKRDEKEIEMQISLYIKDKKIKMDLC